MTALEAAAQAHSDLLDRLDRIEKQQAEILRRIEGQDRRGEAEYLDSAALAQLLGLTTSALRMRLRRGSDLAAIAIVLDGKKTWRRADVEAVIRKGNNT